MFIELVVTAHGRGDTEVFEQHAASAGILGQNGVNRFEHLDSARRHIVEIPHRSRHYVQLACHSRHVTFDNGFARCS